MRDAWRTLRIGDVGQVLTGKTPRTKDPANFGGSIPFITPSDMDGGRFICSTGRYLTAKGADSVRSSMIPARTVLVSCIGSDLGKAAIAERPSVTNQQINSIIVDDKINYLYVYYNLTGRKAEFQFMAGGAAQPIINKSDFSKVEILLPPRAEQDAIAEILGVLDDKIELNRQTNQTLEALAQRLFKSWFVDFDPVKAKMAGRAPANMDAETAALFPDRLVESELGMVPEGWVSTCLGDLISINSRSYTAKTLPDEISYIDISSASEGDVETPSTIAKDVAPSRARRIAVPGDTVWSMVRPNRRAHFFFDASFPTTTVISTGFAVLHPPAAACFWYYLTNHSKFSDYLASRATGAAYPAVNKRIIEEFRFPWPGPIVAEKFDQAVQTFKSRQGQLRQESGTLSQLRDLLLPKLISGQLRVRDAERQVAEVV